MAMHLDHISMSSPNPVHGAHRLRLETTLSFYDGGHVLDSNLANRIFPLGANTYLELGGIVGVEAMAAPRNRPWWFERVRTAGECFTGIGIRVDTREELEAIARKKNHVPARTPTTTIWPNGYAMHVHSALGIEITWTKGFPNWYWYEDFPMHPSGQPPSTAPNITRPDGIAWIEVGGAEKQMSEWLEMPAASFPFRFNGKPPGVYAIGVKTMKGGEIVIRRPSAME